MEKKGWDSSAVNKAVASVEAHTELAHALASGSCSVAMKVPVTVLFVMPPPPPQSP